MPDPTPRQAAAQERIHALLTELVDIIGPAGDGLAEYDPGEGPDGAPLLCEYVVVACWVDDERKDFTTVVPASSMLNHHVVGLLRAGLAYADDYDPH